jgi:hypothetical protein
MHSRSNTERLLKMQDERIESLERKLEDAKDLLRKVLDIPAVRHAVGENHVGNCQCTVCRARAFLEVMSAPKS